jgi:hypothetical protein
MHRAPPEAHEIVPTSHTFGRAQVPPAVQEAQLPALQTMFIPQEVPLDASFPVSWQVAVPVSQLTVPM